MKVYLNAFPWHVSPKNTDWRLYWDIARLSERHPQVQTYLPQAWITGLGPNLAYAGKAVLRRARLAPYAPLAWFPGVKANHVWPPEFRRFAPDVIYTHEYFPRNTGNTPIVFSPGFEDPAEARARGISDAFLQRERVLKRELARKSAIVVLSTGEAGQRMMQAFPESAHKVRALPFYKPDLRPVARDDVIRKQTETGVLRLLFVGLQARLKGLDTVIAALAEVERVRPGRLVLDVYSDFRGGPVPVPEGLPVVLHGAQPHAQVLARFREAHVYVMPSRRDSYGFVFIEAMANGCATIMPDRAVQREMTAGGTAGMLVPAGDSAALTVALLQLIDEPARRLEIALAGHQRYLENYDADPVGRRFIDAFDDAIRNGAGSGT